MFEESKAVLVFPTILLIGFSLPNSVAHEQSVLKYSRVISCATPRNLHGQLGHPGGSGRGERSLLCLGMLVCSNNITVGESWTIPPALRQIPPETDLGEWGSGGIS